MLKTHLEELELLKKIGFQTPNYKPCDNLEEVWEYAKEVGKNRKKLDYFIDGVVVKINDNKLVERLGIVGKTPRAYCAIKFEAKQKITQILDIIWQVGRTGKVTPVAILEPVWLDGTKVSRATLHNYKNVLRMDLKQGDWVIIQKAGDIIPEVVAKSDL